MGLFHHTYPGNRADAEEFGVSLPRMLAVLNAVGISPSAVTLVFDKGASSLLNSVGLEDSGLGWISALPWSQAPKDMREVPIEQMQCCSSVLPGIRVGKGEALVHGRPATCVVLHSSVFQSEQLHSLMANLSKACSKLRALAHELIKSRRKSARETVQKRIAAILAAQWLETLVTTELEGSREHGWSLQFTVDNAALTQLLTHRLGRTVLATNRAEWSAERVASAYHGQATIERQFRSMKEGEGSSWGPMFAWTDSKIRIHSSYCMLGLSLVNWLHRRTREAHIDMSVEHMLEQLAGLQEIVLIYPSSTSGPKPTAKVDTRESLDQIQLIKTLGLDRLRERHQG
jgi:transposase